MANTPCPGSITGTVRNAATRNPISAHTVVALESSYPDPSIEKIISTDDQGRFGFCAIHESGYALVALASDGAGNYYAPAVDFEFKAPAKDIDLMIGGIPTAIPANLVGPVSTDSAGIALDVLARVPIGTDVSSKPGAVIIPLLSPSAGFVKTVTVSGTCTSAGCASYQLILPPQQPQVWSGSEWRRSASPLVYTVEVDAPNCFPNRQFASPVPTSGVPYAEPGITLPMQPLVFSGCR